jgi:uncharacterized protein (DUF305 family)
MKRSSGRAAICALALAACGTTGAEAPPASPAAPVQQPAAPDTARGTAADTARGRSDADVRFMQHMMAHHQQARVMSAMVPERTTRREIRLIAERIDVSQDDEMRQMRSWLRRHGVEAPAAGAHAHGEHASMPGMLTGAELARLAAARGAEFDRLFLEYMIRHHEGAVTMVAQLFATPGAAQSSEMYGFATDVNADQRAEIARMRALLATIAGPGG